MALIRRSSKRWSRKRLAPWLIKNPEPIIELAKDAKKVKTTAEAIEEMRLAKKSAEAARLAEGARNLEKLKNMNNMRKGLRGASNLGVLAFTGTSLGTGAVVALAARQLFRLWVEDRIIDATLGVTESLWIAVNYATMPRTRKEAEVLYARYCGRMQHIPIKVRGVTMDEYWKPVLPKERWLA